jgi:hypothetical protein
VFGILTTYVVGDRDVTGCPVKECVHGEQLPLLERLETHTPGERRAGVARVR